MNDYEAKQERKRERLEAAARRARGESASAYGVARQILDIIPMGQPVLVGHHSERRHRRDLDKIDRSMRKSIEAESRANDLAARAAAVGTGGISQDDPEAVVKLRAELAPLQKVQAQMKAANAAIRKHAKHGEAAQVAALVALLGCSEGKARDLLTPDFCGRIGFADYQTKNNGANIRRIESRIAELLAKESAPVRAPIAGGDDVLTWEIRENKEANRTQIKFSGQPPKEIRERLKAAGFKWAPTEGAWQRHLSNGAWYHAKQALGVKDAPAPVLTTGSDGYEPEPCRALESGMPRCDGDHLARGAACSACDPRSAEERGVLAIPFEADDSPYTNND